MKITFVLPEASLSGGIRVIAIYAERLQQRGHHVTLVSVPRPHPTLRQQMRSLLRGRGWLPAPHQHPSHLDGVNLPHRVLDQRRPITDADVPDADMVIATWWETAEWVWALSPAKGIKVHFVQDYERWGGPTERVDAVYQLPMPKIVVADWLKTLLRMQFQQPTLAVIPNSVDLAQFYAPPRSKQPMPTVGLTYSTMPKKGTDLSLRAVELARRTVPQLRLVGFGNTPAAPQLPLPPDTDYTVRARDHQLRSLYSRCDAWLFGTRIEGFGLPILEAMACRTPVIGTPAGAAPELLAEGAGILVPPDDPEAMAQAIIQVCQMTDHQWRSLSDAAYARASRYTWDEATTQFEAALHRARILLPL